MSASLSIAAAGLQAAGRRFETAARSVVSPGSERKEKAAASKADAPPGVVASQGATGSRGPAGPQSRASGVSSGFDTSEAAEQLFDNSDSTERLIEFKRAEVSYKAQVNLLKTVSRHQDEAIDRLA